MKTVSFFYFLKPDDDFSSLSQEFGKNLYKDKILNYYCNTIYCILKKNAKVEIQNDQKTCVVKIFDTLQDFREAIRVQKMKEKLAK